VEPVRDPAAAGVVVSVNTGGARPYTRGIRRWRSGIVKEPVAGDVPVGPEGFAGDEQADRENHGGPDKAVLAYGSARYDDWVRLHGLPAGPGGFGENLTVSGLDEDSVCIGDTFRTGTALLQVTQPRLPCWKLSARWTRPDLIRLVEDTGWSGWYLRVLEPGTVAAGAAMGLLDRPRPGWPVSAAFRVGRLRDGAELGELAAVPELSAAWRDSLRARLTQRP